MLAGEYHGDEPATVRGVFITTVLSMSQLLLAPLDEKAVGVKQKDDGEQTPPMTRPSS